MKKRMEESLKCPYCDNDISEDNLLRMLIKNTVFYGCGNCRRIIGCGKI